LKLFGPELPRGLRGLSERHPEKQGLKLRPVSPGGARDRLSERHPEKQGLKLRGPARITQGMHLSERHPEKQGLKPPSLTARMVSVRAFRAPSRKTRIETPRKKTMWHFAGWLSERHPEKQGLKPAPIKVWDLAEELSERHPEKQGLKLGDPLQTLFLECLSERHPEKQGLKLISCRIGIECRYPLSERHPEKQGLKPKDSAVLGSSFQAFRAPSRKTRIETMHSSGLLDGLSSFRAPSRKTRIETSLCPVHVVLVYCLSERHPEKQGLKLFPFSAEIIHNTAFRAPSRKTRIETRKDGTIKDYEIDFQSAIQKNKD